MNIFLNGIAGTGMSSLAGLFKQKNFNVSGSDNNFYPPVDKILEDMNINLYKPYNAENIPPNTDLCVVGNIISRGNPEAEHILDNNIDYMSMPRALHHFFIEGKQSVVAAGTHGKTTITSFVAHMLQTAGLSPGFFIGGKPQNFETNYNTGEGDFFVTEGDEYETSFFDRSSKFLKYFPKYLILSALEYDHLDFFSSEALYLKAFQNLVNQVPSNGLLVVNGDYPMVHTAVQKAFTPIKSYGTKTAGNPEFLIKDIASQPGRLSFTLQQAGKKMTLTSSLAGTYNASNFTSGLILGLHLGIPETTLKEAVETFDGVERRLNEINRVKETIFLEDFAHHPTSIKQVLQSIRETYPNHRLVTVFEPRSWSLRRNFFQDRLADSFTPAHEILIKEVFQKEKIPADQRLDLSQVQQQLREQGKKVTLFAETETARAALRQLDFTQPQVIAILSNGSFDGLPAFVKKIEGKKVGG